MLIDYADLINCALGPVGDIDVFRFTGGNGEVVRIQLSGTGGGSPCFELFDPDAMPLGGQVCFNRSADYRLEQTGTHTILIGELGNNQVASYTIAIDRLGRMSPASVPIESNQVIEDELNLGDIDVSSSLEDLAIQFGCSSRAPAGAALALSCSILKLCP